MDSIHDILESNYIIASNEDLGLLVTVNGSYIQIWIDKGDGKYEATEALALSSADTEYDLYHDNFALIVDRAVERADEHIVNEMMDEDDEDYPEYGSIFSRD